MQFILGRAITWLVGVTIYGTIFTNNSTQPRQFLCDKILLKKKLAWGIAH